MAKDEDYEEQEEVVDDEDPYSEKGRGEMLEDDEISSEEQGFLEGYDSANKEEKETKDKDSEEEEESESE